MVLVLVLMLLTYRSPLIAALMLGVVAIAYLIATGAVYGLVEAGATTVSGQSTAILIVLMFGAGTDYCLLIVSRFRDELRRDGDVEAAMARASMRTSPAILASGGIVVAAMLVLGLADFNATREMGPILALGIVVMMAVGLTLMPALLVAFGRRAFWPAIPKVEPGAAAGGPGLEAGQRARAPAPAPAGVRLRRAARRSARSATSAAATTSTSRSSTATRPSPSRARSSCATASRRAAWRRWTS